MSVRAWAASPRTGRRPIRRGAAEADGVEAAGPWLQRALVEGRAPASQAGLIQLQRTAGNRAVQRLLGTVPTVQREPPKSPPGPSEKEAVSAIGPVGAAGGPLPAGTKVTVAPPATAPAPAHGTGEKKEEHAVEFHAEVFGEAAVEKVGGTKPVGKGGFGLEVAGELPKATAATAGTEGGTQFKFITTPELKVKLSSEIEHGQTESAMHAELGVDVARVVAGPWTYRLGVAGEASTKEGFGAKAAVAAEKEIPKAGGLGYKAEVGAGIGQHGTSGEGAMKALWGLKKGERTQVYFFGQVEGKVGKDDHQVKTEGVTTLGIGAKW